MDKHLKILMLEDIAYDAELLERELKKSGLEFTSKVVKNKTDFVNSLTEFKPDVILSDHTLPQFNSREALKLYKDHCLKCPFILVTGTVSEEFAVSSIHEGADDYILKGNLTRLPSAIENALKKREAEKEKEFVLETLKAQNIELSRVNKELDHLVYSASHDLRSPLTSILGLLYILNVEKDEAKQKHYLQLIEKSVKKLDSIIKDIITYSRNARRDININKVDVKGLVQETFNTLKTLDDKVEFDFKLNVKEEVPLFSDKERLAIIINNILSNALTYRDTENPVVAVDVKINQENAIFSFKDNGPGIPAKHLDKIFDMFYRATDKSTGSGLGLYIVKEYLRKLNGKVKVESEEGKGTTFTFSVPNKYEKK